ncbi:MAG: histidine--tRNA ligase [Bacilli bacterium]
MMEKLVTPRTLSGFMELMPQEQIAFNKYKTIIEETYKKYGFLPLDTPIIEAREVLLAKAFGETEKQIYQFDKGDTKLALRFDLTVPLAKFVAANSGELVFPFKRYQIGKVYRGERAQKGRFREFYQCDIDVVGEDTLSLFYDAQIPAIMEEIFNKLEIGPFVIRINNRKILAGLFEYLNLTDKTSEILRTIDKIDKVGTEEIKKELLLEINKEKVEYIINFINIKDNVLNNLTNLNINNEQFISGLNELKEVTHYLDLMNVKNYIIDLTIARGLDYYTGTVYETNLIEHKSIGSIASGGRYDNLAGYYTQKKLPGVGMSIGLTRLFYKLNELGLINKKESKSVEYLIIPMNEINDYTFKIYNKLKKENKSVDICESSKNFKNKMKYANRINALYTVIIGEDEEKNNTYTVKNMETGNQQTKTYEDEMI